MESKVEKYIQDYTNKCSNKDGFSYVPWLTPDDARHVAEIAKEEVIEKAVEWFQDYFEGSVGGRICVESFKEYMEESV